MSISRAVSPISGAEFTEYLRCCFSNLRWPARIAIATSGGPDSTCLLFLLKQYVDNQQDNPDYGSKRVVALSVDHGLQPSSKDMATQCEETSRSLGIRHISLRVKWGSNPYPEKPDTSTPGVSFESVARDARYYAIRRGMELSRASVVAFAHHADDQVETALMRSAKGSTELGMGGMRYVRRWGMGTRGRYPALTFAGMQGMDKWIVRPLLGVSKDRILATCEANNLTYITDATNFQPALTTRNALRAILSRQLPEHTDLPLNVAETVRHLEQMPFQTSGSDIHIKSGREALRNAVSLLTTKVEESDRLATTALGQAVLSSPPGTLLLSASRLSSVTDPTVRLHMATRVLRYISCHPWGDVRSESGRRNRSIQQIVDKLWTENLSSSSTSAFSAGSGVLWQPVILKDNNILLLSQTDRDMIASGLSGYSLVWLASRQPPYKRQYGVSRIEPLTVDVTRDILGCRLRRQKHLEVLYDNRFLITFDLQSSSGEAFLASFGRKSELVPSSDHRRLCIVPQTAFYWPKVVLKDASRQETLLHNCIDLDVNHLPTENWTWPTAACRVGDSRGKRSKVWWQEGNDSETVRQDWIRIEWIRPMSAI